MKIETTLGALIAALLLFLTGTLALLQQPEVVELGDVSGMAWIVLGIGSLVGFLKDFQALTARRFLANVTGSGNVHAPAWTAILAVLIASSMLSSCAGTRAAYKAAEGIEETAMVVGEHYYALVREGNRLKREGLLAGTYLANTQDLVRTTRPVVLELANMAQAYALVKSADNEAALERALANAAIAVSKLVDLIEGADSSQLILDIEEDLERILAEYPAQALPSAA